MNGEDFAKFQEEGRIEFITFHPSYSYEEFIEGIRVKCDGKSDNVTYEVKDGIFKKLCKKSLSAALKLSEDEIESLKWKDIFNKFQETRKDISFETVPKFVLIIDEINRGDMAKIFGELITLLEADKRLGAENELVVELPYTNDLFGIPPNLYIIATMNTADRSIALIDVALRRRFGFVEMNPDFNALEKEHIEKNRKNFEDNGAYELLIKSKDAVIKLNERICTDPAIGRDRQIGHSFLFKVFNKSDLLMVWRYEIFPLLEEYCYGDYKKINRLLFGKDSDTEWIGASEGIKNIENLEVMLSAILTS